MWIRRQCTVAVDIAHAGAERQRGDHHREAIAVDIRLLCKIQRLLLWLLLPDAADDPRITEIAVQAVHQIVAKEALPASAGDTGGDFPAVAHRHIDGLTASEVNAGTGIQASDPDHLSIDQQCRIAEVIGRTICERATYTAVRKDDIRLKASIGVRHVVVKLEVTGSKRCRVLNRDRLFLTTVIDARMAYILLHGQQPLDIACKVRALQDRIHIILGLHRKLIASVVGGAQIQIIRLIDALRRDVFQADTGQEWPHETSAESHDIHENDRQRRHQQDARTVHPKNLPFTHEKVESRTDQKHIGSENDGIEQWLRHLSEITQVHQLLYIPVAGETPLRSRDGEIFETRFPENSRKELVDVSTLIRGEARKVTEIIAADGNDTRTLRDLRNDRHTIRKHDLLSTLDLNRGGRQ